MADGMNATTATNTHARDLVQEMRAVRDEALGELGQLTEAELRYPSKWANVTRHVNFSIRAFALHEIDHLQHVIRLLRGRGVELSEAQLMLMKVQALRGEIEGLLLTLTDEQVEAEGPDSGWSVRQVAEHMAETDRTYLRNVRTALEAGRAGRPLEA